MKFVHKTKHHCVVCSYCLKLTTNFGLYCFFKAVFIFFYFFKWE